MPFSPKHWTCLTVLPQLFFVLFQFLLLVVVLLSAQLTLSLFLPHQMWMNVRRPTEAARLSAVTPLEVSTAGVLLDSNWTKMVKPVKVSPLLYLFGCGYWIYHTVQLQWCLVQPFWLIYICQDIKTTFLHSKCSSVKICFFWKHECSSSNNCHCIEILMGKKRCQDDAM